MSHMRQSDHTDVLIIGGGFGGINAARRLDRLIKRRLSATVMLISRTNFQLFTPLLAEVAASLIDSLHAALIPTTNTTITSSSQHRS